MHDLSAFLDLFEIVLAMSTYFLQDPCFLFKLGFVFEYVVAFPHLETEEKTRTAIATVTTWRI